MGHRQQQTHEPSRWQRLQVYLDPAWLQQRSGALRHEQRVRSTLLRHAAVLVYSFRRMGAEELTRGAAALTYNTLISIIPVMAVAFALFEAFGGLQRFKAPLEALIVQNIAVGREDEVRTWISTFIENINAGAIAGFGVIFLFYSAIGLLTNIESTFNHIWGVRETRPMHIRLSIYWAVLTLSPPLVGISISLTSSLQSSAVINAISAWTWGGLIEWLFSLGSAVAMIIALVLAYVAVPNTKVGLREALVGGVLAGVVWAAVKGLFFWISAGSVKYNAIYGALGLLPLLMVWLYLSWLIVLFGMAYTRAYQVVRHERLDLPQEALSQAKRERLGALLLAEVGRRFVAGQPAPTAKSLAVTAGAPLAFVKPLLEILVKHRLLAGSSDDGTARYLPGRSLHQLDLALLVRVLRYHTGFDQVLRWDEQSKQLGQALDRADEAALDQLAAWNLHRWLEALPERPELQEQEEQQAGSSAGRPAPEPSG